MAVFNVIKKNRKYFAATKDGYKCKIVIDEASENIELGENDLQIEDISVRTKYGTDLIFKVVSNTTEELKKGICTLVHDRYNSVLVKRCHELNGKWDAENKAWVFPLILEAEVEDLDYQYNADVNYYDVTLDEYEACEPFSLAGYKIATATGRDSGAVLANDVILLSGNVSSGGSVKNWTTLVKGVIRIELSKPLADAIAKEGYEIEKVVVS